MKSIAIAAINAIGNIIGLRMLAIELSLVTIKFMVINLKPISRQLGFSLVALLAIGLQSPTQAKGSGPLSLQEAHLAVWQMNNPDAEFPHYHSGTATFVGPQLAITNYHVLTDVLSQTLPHEVALSQKGSSKTLRIHRVLAVSRVYDLALFETTEPGHGYLELASHRETPLEQLTQLFLLGYPGSRFRAMKQKEQTQVLYEDELYYSVALKAPYDYRREDSAGSSGGPILNTQGQIMGIISDGTYNLIFGIKLQHLKSLIQAGTEIKQEPWKQAPWWLTLCASYNLPKDCTKAENEKHHNLAKQGHPIAQYRLWLQHGESPTGMDWLQESADNGFALSLINLVYLLADDANSNAENVRVFRLALRAAKQHLATAQLELARMLLEATGTSRSRPLAIYWLEKAANQGLNIANQALNRP